MDRGLWKQSQLSRGTRRGISIGPGVGATTICRNTIEQNEQCVVLEGGDRSVVQGKRDFLEPRWRRGDLDDDEPASAQFDLRERVTASESKATRRFANRRG